MTKLLWIEFQIYFNSRTKCYKIDCFLKIVEVLRGEEVKIGYCEG